MELIGKEIEFGIGVEKVRGTAQLTAEKWVKKVTANVMERAEKVMDDSTRNVLADSLGSRIVKKFIEGDVKGILHADPIGYMFYNLFGAVSSSNVSGSVYSHTFSVQNSIQHTALTLFMKDGSVDQLSLSNCMIGSLEISATTDDYVRFTASFQGKASATNADTPSYDTEYDFIGKDITVKFADSEAGLTTATAERVKDMTITFNTGLISDHCFGSYNPDDIYNGQMNIGGELTLNFDSQTFKDLYLADTYKYMQIKITGDANIGGGNYPDLQITLNRVQINDWSKDDTRDEIVPQTVGFKAYYNETDSEQVAVVLQNLTSEYDQAVSD